jgi:hypothetical protein
VERRAHELLTEHRVNPRREFFRIDPAAAGAALQQAALDEAGLLHWYEFDEPTRIADGDRVALTGRRGELFVLIDYRSSPYQLSDPLDVWQIHADGDLIELMGSDNEDVVASFSANDSFAIEDPVPYLDRANLVPNGYLNGREAVLRGQRLLWIDGVNHGRRSPIALFEIDTTCQVTCRTWNPQFTTEGFPLILNTPTRDPKPLETETVRNILKLPAMKLSGPPGRTSPTLRQAPPDYWLKQLAPVTRSSGRIASRRPGSRPT